MADDWKRYKADFDALTDEEIALEVRRAEDTVAEEQDWLDAVASWEAAGKPRSGASPEPCAAHGFAPDACCPSCPDPA